MSYTVVGCYITVNTTVYWYYEHISLLSSVRRSVALSACSTYVITFDLRPHSPLIDQTHAGYYFYLEDFSTLRSLEYRRPSVRDL